MTKKITTAKDHTGQEFAITREFAAPCELVFNAWTDPGQLAHWWGPRGFTNPVSEWDVRPGGKIYVVMRAPNGERYPMGGEFREIVAPQRLVFTTGALDEKGEMMFEFLHTATFVEQDGRTKLTLNSRVLKTTADANRYIGGFEAGMTQSLEKLDELLLNQPFVIERTFAAPVALVWRAITTKEDMSHWYFDLKEFKPEAGFEFQFVVELEGNTYDHRCKVTEVVPQKRIAYTWRYAGHAGDSLVTFELSADGKGTKLKLTHEGLGTFPRKPAFARKNFMQGWTQLIGSELKQFVESTGLKSGALEIVSTRVFDASRARVFQAFSEPAQLALWWGPDGFTNTIHEFELKPGGKWRLTMRGPDGTAYENESKFLEVVQPARVVFQHIEPIHRFQMAMTFADESGKTRLTWHMTFESADEFSRVKDFIGKANEQNFDRLAAHLGAQQMPNEVSSDREIVITRDFDAPRELVWEAWTNPKHVVNWWGPRGFSTTIETMDFRVGGVWKHVMHGPDGVNYPNEKVFKEIVKPEKIVFSHGGRREGGPSVDAIATWTFDEIGKNRTRVSLRMVFPSAAERDRVVKEFGAIEGGRQTLERLGEFLAEALCKPFVMSREFDAPRELVWKAWTERERFMQWFGPKGCTIPVATMDFRPGGGLHYCMRTPDGNEMWGKWIFREIIAPEKIVLANSFSDKDGNLTRPPFPGAWPLQMLTETTFTERDGKTTVTLKWLPLDATAEEIKTFDNMRGSFTQGWTGTFDQLAIYLQKK